MDASSSVTPDARWVGPEHVPTTDHPADPAYGSLRRAIAAVIGTRFTEGNRVDVLRNGDEIFPAMLDAVRSARRSIDFVTFVYWTGDVADRFVDALVDRASAGVRVRVLLDWWGSRSMPDDAPDRLRDAGAAVELFRPAPRWKFWELDHRTHRKILVCDDEVAFTGGVGIARQWEGDGESPDAWRDTHFRIRGPAVLDLRAVFLADWRNTGHPIVASDLAVPEPRAAGDLAVSVIDGSAQIGFNEVQRVMEALALAAEERLWIQTPYFNPDDAVVRRIVEAHRRGVDVEILIPGDHIDKPPSRTLALERLEPIVAAGVSVWSYRPSMMHVKAILVDGVLAFVGSANFNRRSVEKDEENAAVVYDGEFTAELESHFLEDREESDSIESVDLSLADRALLAMLRPIRREF